MCVCVCMLSGWGARKSLSRLIPSTPPNPIFLILPASIYLYICISISLLSLFLSYSGRCGSSKAETRIRDPLPRLCPPALKATGTHRTFLSSSAPCWIRSDSCSWCHRFWGVTICVQSTGPIVFYSLGGVKVHFQGL